MHSIYITRLSSNEISVNKEGLDYLFKDAVGLYRCITSDCRIILNGEREMIRKEAFLAYVKVIFQLTTCKDWVRSRNLTLRSTEYEAKVLTMQNRMYWDVKFSNYVKFSDTSERFLSSAQSPIQCVSGFCLGVKAAGSVYHRQISRSPSWTCNQKYRLEFRLSGTRCWWHPSVSTRIPGQHLKIYHDRLLPNL